MGWGITVNGLWLNKIIPSQLKDRLEENEQSIRSVRDELIALASFTGTTYYNGENHIAITDHASRRIPELMEWLEEMFTENMLIRRALEDPKSTEVDE